MEKYRSFLVINPFGIGDVLFSTPVIRQLKKAYPDADIYYLCNKRAKFLVSENPLIKKIFVYERDEFESKDLGFFAKLRKYSKFISEIKKEKIDVAIDLSLNTKFGLYALLAGIKIRAGLNFKKRGKLLNKKLELRGYQDRHVASYYLDVLRLIGIEPKETPIEVYPDQKSKEEVALFFKENNIETTKPVIGIAPCGGQAFGPKAFMKRWPITSYAALAESLVQKYNATILIFAGPDEAEEVEKLFEMVQGTDRIYSFCQDPIEKIVALVERCDLFIGNDTGPLRFADGLQKKIIAFFGPVNEKVYGTFPFDPRRHVLISKNLPCRPCYQNFRLPDCDYDLKCLKSISVDEVLEKVEMLGF